MTALADTSIFIAQELGRALHGNPPSDIAVSTVTIGELRLGVLAAEDVATRHRRLSTLEIALLVEPLSIDEGVANAWAGLIAALREQGKRMPINDSWIAATAIAHNMPVVTQDDDFASTPGLEVIRL
ncbi:MAG: type II toxin-antitoxin system toxin ribonuclease C4 [Acidimicrobiia bacterium]|nr:MAG: type II toxin-antitoxin system toxin ribonuclease C4 [Acidimicrobiia bacterium]